MYCPECRGEYRPGIARCPTCEVDLVDSLGSAPGGGALRPDEGDAHASDETFFPYCGFLGLAEARHARDQVRARGIRSEIVIRETPGSDLRAPIEEEFWLKIPPRSFAAAAEVLGYDEAASDAAEEGELVCSACGRAVASEARSCPHCGERFEDA